MKKNWKKVIALLVVAVLGISMVACNSSGKTASDEDNSSEIEDLQKQLDEVNEKYDALLEENNNEGAEGATEEPPAEEAVTEEPAAEEEVAEEPAANESAEEENPVITSIQADFDTTIEQLKSDLETMYNNVGNTSADYIQNSGYVSEWYTTCQTESEGLFVRTYNAGIDYYKFVADNIDHNDFNALDNALDVFYDEIIDKALNNFYDVIIDETFDGIYDTYDNMLMDSDEYDAWSDMYEAWSDAWSDIYEAWSDAWSDLYEAWSDIWGAFTLDENFDVDATLTVKNEL